MFLLPNERTYIERKHLVTSKENYRVLLMYTN